MYANHGLILATKITAPWAASFLNRSSGIFPTERSAPWAALSKRSDNASYCPEGSDLNPIIFFRELPPGYFAMMMIFLFVLFKK
jgi:hypothetical protein